MRKSKTLQRIRSGEVIRTCVLGHYIPAYIFHAAHAGYDCIWLDLEHRAMPRHQVESLLVYSHLYDIDIMVRPPGLEKTGLYRFLEDGAAGLLIPHVSTVEKAEMLVDAVKFPPLGDRGLDNAGIDADFLVHDPDEFTQWANRETFLCVQVETPQAVHNVDAIAAVEGVDMIFVGPGDLGLRLRQTGEMSLDEAWQTVAESCKRHGVAFGGPAVAPEEMVQRRQLGAQLLVGSSEFLHLRNGLRDDLQKFDRLE